MQLTEQQRHGKFCQWFDPQPDPRDEENFECGEPAMHKVKVHGGVTKAFVYLCEYHKTHVNNDFAARRQNDTHKTRR